MVATCQQGHMHASTLGSCKFRHSTTIHSSAFLSIQGLLLQNRSTYINCSAILRSTDSGRLIQTGRLFSTGRLTLVGRPHSPSTSPLVDSWTPILVMFVPLQLDYITYINPLSRLHYHSSLAHGLTIIHIHLYKIRSTRSGYYTYGCIFLFTSTIWSLEDRETYL